MLIEGVHAAECRIGALSGEESVLVCVGKCLRISNTFLAEGCVHRPYQVESQVAKSLHLHASFSSVRELWVLRSGMR